MDKETYFTTLLTIKELNARLSTHQKSIDDQGKLIYNAGLEYCKIINDKVDNLSLRIQWWDQRKMRQVEIDIQEFVEDFKPTYRSVSPIVSQHGELYIYSVKKEDYDENIQEDACFNFTHHLMWSSEKEIREWFDSYVRPFNKFLDGLLQSKEVKDAEVSKRRLEKKRHDTAKLIIKLTNELKQLDQVNESNEINGLNNLD